MYKILDNFIIRDSDGASIPMDENNLDYREYLKWVAAGNTAPAFTMPVSPADARNNDYIAQGITSEAIVYALWKSVVNGDNSSLNALKGKVTAVNAKYKGQADNL